MSSEEKKRKEFDWPIYPKEIPEINYEIRVLPLQKEISEVRKIACKSYTNIKNKWDIASEKYSKSYENVKGQLNSYGIHKDSLAVQGGSVGGAMLLGYLLARKRTMWRKIMYPLVGGALVGGAFYLSYSENKKWLKNEFKNLIQDYKKQ